MDTMESQGGTPYTAPGLVPGILGVVIALLGVVLGVRALRGREAEERWQGTAIATAVTEDLAAGTAAAATAAKPNTSTAIGFDASAPPERSESGTAPAHADEGDDPTALAIGLALCLAYAIGLVGRVPFVVATFLFVATYVLVFEWQRRGRAGQRVRGFVLALVYGAATSIVVSTLFEQIFYVRLP
jgi:hypothetical protein